MRASEIISELKKNRVVPKLVDDQLKLVGETRNLSNDLLKLIKDRKNELRSFLMEAMDGVSSTPIPSIQKQGRYLATHAQKRIWILSQFKGGGPAYNIVAGFYLKGPIFLIILNAAFNAVIERHESLRTLFKDEDSELRQIILDQLRIKVDFENIENTTDVKSYLKAEEEKFRNFHFDLQRGPLISIRLFRISELEHALLLGVHHIVCDGWSATIIFREVMHWYNEYRRGITPVARSLKIQYKDFASWQDHRIADSKGQKAKDFWNRQFSTLINPLNLPVDYPGAAIKNFEGGLFRSYFEDQFYTRISSFCKENHTTLFNFFRATLAILLNKFSGQDDLVIGTPVSGRNHFDLEDQVGMYVNTLPLRITIDVRDSFLAFLTKISDHSFEAFQYQDYPFDKIIEDLPISWNAGGNPLFDVMMVVQDIMHGETIARINQESEFELCELDSYLYQSSCIQRENVPSKFDLSFNFAFDAGNKYYLEIEYAAKLFKKESISRILNAYRLIVVQVLDSPGTILNAIEIIDTAQKHNILTLFNATEADYVREKTIVHLFEEQAARTPDHIAVACEGRELSYADLNGMSNELGDYLRREYGIKADDLVGVQLDRSEWMVLVLLGVLKSGGAYVPIDPAYPQERIDYMIKDSGCKLVIGEEELERYKQKGRIYSRANLPCVNRPGDLAYVIYTSGTTGLPKGVMIEHRNVNAFISWCIQEFAGDDIDVVFGVTSICFDLSVFELFYTLSVGKKLRLLSNALSIGDYIGEEKKILLNTVPGAIGELQREGTDFSGVKSLNMAGEAIPSRVVGYFAGSGIRLRNLYGPTETTTYSTLYRIEEDGAILIGRPIANTRIYIVNAGLELQPIGVVGEICIGGEGLSRGYLNKEALTAEKFVNDPFRAGERMYKTGDQGRWLEDGNIVLTGRRDDQVKVRGYRVELGEIEKVLSGHRDVEGAVVVLRRDGEETGELVAYVVGRETMDTGAIRSYLSERLPSYMVPGHIVPLGVLPQTSNGKVDKRRLPDPSGLPGAAGTEYVGPGNETESKLVSIWQEVLGREQVGIKDNFFELGGHSLKAAQVISKINKHFLVRINIQTLFKDPTIENIAAQIDFILDQNRQKPNKEKLIKIEL